MNQARGNSSWYGKDPASRHYKLKGVAVAASAGLAAAALAAVPASATIVNVAAGHNITVFHNIDFVATSGWADGDVLTMTILRNGTQIGTSSGPAVNLAVAPTDPPDFGLETNHGPEGAPVAGDCWTTNTPDIRPGDRVTISNGTVTDAVIVDNIAFTGDPQLQSNGNITVPFVARRANGNAIPAGFIDSGEFRAASNNSVRFEGVPVVRRGAPGQYNLVYRAPYRPTRNDDEAPFNQTQLRRALLGDGHAVGFGHVDPVPREAMLQDGLGDSPGPAPGCAAPSAQWGVTTAFPGNVNASNLARGLTVRGLATGATAVNVELRDGTAPVVTKAATGTNNWSVSFTRAQLRSLNGNVRVVGRYDFNGGTITGKTSSFLKDTVRPNAPRATRRPGTYRAPRRTGLLSAAGNTIRYTVGAGRQARPTATKGAVYQRRIRLAAPKQVIKAVAVDRAGNVSPVKRLVYRIRR